jgi:hypothetical protein
MLFFLLLLLLRTKSKDRDESEVKYIFHDDVLQASHHVGIVDFKIPSSIANV